MELLNNEREIEPIPIWVIGEFKNSTILRLVNYSGYDFDQNAGDIYYELRTVENDQSVLILNGTLKAELTLIQNWASDDQVIFDYVAEKINLILV